MGRKAKVKPELEIAETVTEEVVVETQEEPPIEQVKHLFQSKVFWVNILSFVAFFIQKEYGFIFDESMQAMLLTLINIGLRTVTTEAVKWK